MFWVPEESGFIFLTGLTGLTGIFIFIPAFNGTGWKGKKYHDNPVYPPMFVSDKSCQKKMNR